MLPLCTSWRRHTIFWEEKPRPFPCTARQSRQASIVAVALDALAKTLPLYGRVVAEYAAELEPRNS